MTRTMATAAFFVCLTLAACAAVPEDVHHVQDAKLKEEKPRDFCPPLPSLSQDATRFEKRVWEMTVIELYIQCAESKK